MPIEGALITQFLGFVALYYVDLRATTRGWTPHWYRTYRFILTFIVGASIVLTLIGRGELPDHIPGSVDRAKVFREGSEERLAEDEKARARKKKDAAKEDDREGKVDGDKTEGKTDDDAEGEGKEDKTDDESSEGKDEKKGDDKSQGKEDKSGDKSESKDDKSDDKSDKEDKKSDDKSEKDEGKDEEKSDEKKKDDKSKK